MVEAEDKYGRFNRQFDINIKAIETAAFSTASELPNLPLFNVENFGAVGDGVTDDYQAIKDAWDAMLESSAGGLLYFPRAVTYRVEATLERISPTSDKAYALYPMPLVSAEGPLKKTYGVLGVGEPYSVRAASSFGVDGNAQQVATASVLFVDYSTPFAWHATNGHPSIIGFPDADKTGHSEDNIVSNVHFYVDGMIFRQPNNPSMAGMNLELCSTRRIRSVRFDVESVLDSVVEPTHPTGVALLDSKSNNNVAIPIEFFVAEGYYAGLPYTEHSDVRSAVVLRCKIAIHNRRSCSHFGKMGMLKLEQCPYQMAGYDPEGTAPNLGVVPWIGGTIVIDFMDVEHYAYEARENNTAGVPWIYPPVNGCDIYAPNGGLSGSIRGYSRINSEPAPPTGIGIAPFGAGADIYVLGNTDSGLGISGFGIYNLTGDPITINGGLRHLGNAPENPATSAPNAPTIGTATAGVESASVTFTPSVSGEEATSFRVISTPGSVTATGSSSPINVTGLTAGVSYTFTVRASNLIGNSSESSASNSVVPTSPVALPEDNFNRSNGNLGTAVVGGAWQGDSSWQIASNKARNASTGAAWLPTGVDDMIVEADLTYDSLESGLIARVTDANNLLYLDVTHDNPTTASINIYKRVAGAFTAIGTTEHVNTSISATLNLKLECSGDTIRAYVDDVLLVTATDSVQTGQGAGIICLAGPNPTIFDNFLVTAP